MANVARIHTVAPTGFEGAIVEVESHMAKGLPGLQIVGLGNKAIDEAKERVKSAIINTLLEYPARKITINLAPAELPKDGTLYDLPIALSILTSSGQLDQASTANAIFAGELALNGDIRPIKGVIGIVEAARNAGFSIAYLPETNIAQASLIPDITLVGVSSLKKLFLHLKQEVRLEAYNRSSHEPKRVQDTSKGPFLDTIQGQEQAKQCLLKHSRTCFLPSRMKSRLQLLKYTA
jgi:magnesium chelatase family protein